jgi:hypothetical protein
MPIDSVYATLHKSPTKSVRGRHYRCPAGVVKDVDERELPCVHPDEIEVLPSPTSTPDESHPSSATLTPSLRRQTVTDLDSRECPCLHRPVGAVTVPPTCGPRAAAFGVLALGLLAAVVPSAVRPRWERTSFPRPVHFHAGSMRSLSLFDAAVKADP